MNVSQNQKITSKWIKWTLSDVPLDNPKLAKGPLFNQQ